MELDELQYLFDKQRTRTAEELAQYLAKQSHSVIAKIIRSMQLEMALALLFGPAAGVWFFLTDLLFYKVIAAILFVFCLVFFIYIRKLFARVKTYQLSALPVKKNLEAIIRLVSEFIALYFNLTMLLLPLVCVTGLFTIRADNMVTFNTWNWIMYAAWFIGWSVFMYFFTKWYLKKLYGNYLDELRGCLGKLGE